MGNPCEPIFPRRVCEDWACPKGLPRPQNPSPLGGPPFHLMGNPFLHETSSPGPPKLGPKFRTQMLAGIPGPRLGSKWISYGNLPYIPGGPSIWAGGHLGPRPFWPWAIWDHLGPGPFGTISAPGHLGPFWSRAIWAHLGSGPFGTIWVPGHLGPFGPRPFGPIWVPDHLGPFGLRAQVGPFGRGPKVANFCLTTVAQA